MTLILSKMSVKRNISGRYLEFIETTTMEFIFPFKDVLVSRHLFYYFQAFVWILTLEPAILPFPRPECENACCLMNFC